MMAFNFDDYSPPHTRVAIYMIRKAFQVVQLHSLNDLSEFFQPVLFLCNESKQEKGFLKLFSSSMQTDVFLYFSVFL